MNGYGILHGRFFILTPCDRSGRDSNLAHKTHHRTIARKIFLLLFLFPSSFRHFLGWPKHLYSCSLIFVCPLFCPCVSSSFLCTVSRSASLTPFLSDVFIFKMMLFSSLVYPSTALSKCMSAAWDVLSSLLVAGHFSLPHSQTGTVITE